MPQFHQKPVQSGQAAFMLHTFAAALKRGDVQSGFVLIEVTDGNATMAASVDFNDRWKGHRNEHGPDFEFGEWVE